MNFINLPLLFLLVFSSLSHGATFEKIWPELSWDRPLYMLQSSEKDFYVVEQDGLVWRLSVDKSKTNPTREKFLDITAAVWSPSDGSHGEEGLLGFALHPDFPKVPFLYTYCSRKDPKRRTVLASYQLKSGSKHVDVSSEKILYSIDQPYANHNGGMILFDTQKRLLVGVGDGGSANDPLNAGQNLKTPLGKILRFDVGPMGDLKPAKENILKPLGEIFAYGLRNPWRFSLDNKTGDLWVGDVGQNEWEEVSLVNNGDNLGWRLKEGAVNFKPNSQNKVTLVDPKIVYGHNAKGGYSITGGYVYRGPIKTLQGKYFFGDYVTGNTWSIDADLLKKSKNLNIDSAELLKTKVQGLASFAQDQAGNLYAISLDQGAIYVLR